MLIWGVQKTWLSFTFHRFVLNKCMTIGKKLWKNYLKELVKLLGIGFERFTKHRFGCVLKMGRNELFSYEFRKNK